MWVVLLLPLLLPLLLAGTLSTMVSGRLISRTGRYKAFPIAGLALMSVGLLLLSACSDGLPAQDIPREQAKENTFDNRSIVTGAERTAVYLPQLRGKRVAVVTNQTGTIGNTHLVDSLLALKVEVVRVFAPEHGFRGDADAGERVVDQRDARTGLPLVSLYGANKKPKPTINVT